ncbi:NAD(P)H-dependent amine dehydrogenase family protein [Actinomadura xylanilytica]|uniref:NAD(P)H-dependent amine dehydrogenase family protein n=1 Tax=Actinomadura xylanilytica TaxID=887459 RepID=UPI00255A887E|nr:dihydrodipicolinate reductase [Actinomadura xylanilytica]MDL4771914.1 dihydrodipicolinate reductase [Actinomadura xylanilytica]
MNQAPAHRRSDGRPLRVVQWATGAVGRSVIRGVLDRPGLELAGVRVFSPAKDGVDAGVLAGRDPIGVTATTDTAEILDLDADCVVHAPGQLGQPYGDLDTVCALLASGKNVISLTGLVYPYAQGPGLVAELEDACKRGGGVSVHGSGVNPGFMADLMPLVLSRLSRQITHVYARECSDFAGHPSWRMVHDMVGFAKTEESYLRSLRPARTMMRAGFAESLHLVAAGLGIELDEVDVDVDHRLARHDFTIAAGRVPKGTVAAARWTFSGLVDGHPVITIEAVHKADASQVTDWGGPGYAVRVHGRPSITLTTDEDWVSNGISAAAAHALNAIPVVCAAAPGIRTFLDLPLVTGRASVPTRATAF